MKDIEKKVLSEHKIDVNKTVTMEQVYTALKESYLEIANGYSVSYLKHDSDKVASVASAFRQRVLDKLK